MESKTLELKKTSLDFIDLLDDKNLPVLQKEFEGFLGKTDRAFADLYRKYMNFETEFFEGDESEFLIVAARHLQSFLAGMFDIETELYGFKNHSDEMKIVYDFKKLFVVRRVMKKDKSHFENNRWIQSLDLGVASYRQAVWADVDPNFDDEIVMSKMVMDLYNLSEAFKKSRAAKNPVPVADKDVLRTKTIRKALTDSPEAYSVFSSILSDDESEGALEEFVNHLLDHFETYLLTLRFSEDAKARIKSWNSFFLPEAMEFEHLVKVERPGADDRLAEWMVGPCERHRARDGFKLTDRRYEEKAAMGEMDYCIICHPRQRDHCRRGITEKKGEDVGKLKTNPLGVKLTGCPLDERISEMHQLRKDGLPVAAMSMAMLDNPMVAGTGHRICNDCMKACIFQTQDPVNIPQAETRIVTEVLELPWGFEIYCLLTRWMPLSRKRPYKLPYNGKKVLVVGLGPAGYTLAHYLTNEGFGVVAIDGLKIEPIHKDVAGSKDSAPKPVKFFKDMYKELDERILQGFGGVSEYGITVRWDKNFLTLLYLTLARKRNLQMIGGVRFGGTVSIEDAFDEYGFDHICMATGAGKPTIVRMKNNISRGIRKASDFLMALQLTGAGKPSSLANLQLRLPVVVIGGGLTAIDTCTEAMAYYPVQVEKVLDRYEKTVAAIGEDAYFNNEIDGRSFPRFGEEELGILNEFLAHGREIREERKRAEKEGKVPDFAKLVQKWGGAWILYRKTMHDSPSYRLNHEEIIKALEEGINFVELHSPVEAKLDKYGHVESMLFERQEVVDGKYKNTGDIREFKARSVFVAAGTTPNTIYEREHPGTFEMDDEKWFFKLNKFVDDDVLQPDAGESAFFSSYVHDGKFISVYGDNHPAYAGNVVRAMASARNGYPEVVKLFEKELANLDPSKQDERDAELGALKARLEDDLVPRVVRVDRLTPTIVEVIIRAPAHARKFHPGQFFRLQNYEADAKVIEGIPMALEGIALTGAWVDKGEGLLSLIVLEMGVSSRLCAALKPGERIVAMGPTGAPTHIPTNETVMLVGGGLGNAVLFSIGAAMKEAGNRVLYFAGYKNPRDFYKREDIEKCADVVVYATDIEPRIEVRRPQDRNFCGNIVQAMMAYDDGKLEPAGKKPQISLAEVDRIIAIGSDGMMRAVKEARFAALNGRFKETHVAIGSINSPMQCMMKEVCAQCLQKHVDPKTGQETKPVFSCFNQDQELDRVDFQNLRQRLSQNTVQEKVTNLFLNYLLSKENIMLI
ncbi:MAG: FAD-dependent oxidoreductase [Planctomycetes bacterium]|nr:FAD-dependent oxidoreductase [Planctomycetota bacterium]